MKPESREELDWLAFRYLANELCSAEQVAFEERLAEEQPAREAVARAVELTEVLSAARELDKIVVRSHEFPAPAPKSHNTWSVPAAWMSVGAAACLLLVSLWSFGPSLTPEPSSKTVVENPEALKLARAWSSARDEFAAQEAANWEPEASRAVEPEVSATPSAFAGVELDDMGPMPMPSWLLSAVAGEARENAAPGIENNETREN